MEQVNASQLMVLAFTDLVRSTDLKVRLGDAVAGRLISRHDQIVQHIAHRIPRAELLKDTGDGYLVRFATPSDAVCFALSLQQAMAAEDWGPDRLEMRIGIHLGEVTELEREESGRPKLAGLAVDITDRVTKLAGSGQILLTQSAFDSARQNVREHPALESQAAPKLLWLAHGPYLFQGSEEPLQVFEVGGEGIAPLAAPPGGDKARRAIRAGEELTLGWRPAADLELPGHPHWTLVGKIGEGGFGEVWLAQHRKTHSRRVLKFCFEPDRLRALKREVVLFRLMKEALGERRDIVRVIDFQFETAPYFIEVEYVPGGNLTDWSAAQGGIEQVALETRIRLAAEAASAVSAAHSVGILHKDIKPANLLIQVDGEDQPYARLTDFGIGILTDQNLLAKHNITVTGFTQSMASANDSSRTGTRMYSPPELLTGRPFTTHGDVYALGVLLYQLVVGDLQRPLGVGWERSVEDELLREDIAACVDGDPQRRLASADRLVERLHNLPQRRQERARLLQQHRRRERHRRLRRLAAVATVLLAMAGVVTWISFAARRASDTAALTNQIAASLEHMTGTAEDLRIADELVSKLDRLSREEAATLRGRINDRFGSIIATRIQRPGLRQNDLTDIEADLRMLEARDGNAVTSLRQALAGRLRVWETTLQLQPPFDTLPAIFEPADAAVERNSVVLKGDGARFISTRLASEGNVQLAVTLDIDLANPADVRIAFNMPPDKAYSFHLVTNPESAPEARALFQGASIMVPPGRCRLAISRDVLRDKDLKPHGILRRREIDLKQLGAGPLRVAASWEDSTLSLQVNGLPPLVIEDPFPLGRRDGGFVSLRCTPGTRILNLGSARQSRPAAPNPLERADELYLTERMQEALPIFRAQQLAADEQVRAAARYKEALCLVALNRREEAAALLETVIAEQGDRWPLLAAFQLHLIRRKQGHLEEANSLVNLLFVRYPRATLLQTLTDSDLHRLSGNVSAKVRSLSVLKLSEEDVRFTENVIGLLQLRDDSPKDRATCLNMLMRVYHASGSYQRAMECAAQLMEDKEAAASIGAQIDDVRHEYSWLLRLTDRPQRASEFLKPLVYDTTGVRPGAHRLLVEVARVAAAEGQQQRALEALDKYILLAGSPREIGEDKFWFDAHLMRGFLLERSGDTDGATAAWAAGLEGTAEIETLRGRALFLSAVLGSLSGKWTDADARKFVDAALAPETVGATHLGGEPVSFLLQRVVQLPPAVVLNMWRTTRGRECARQMAFLTVPFPEYTRLPACVLLHEYLRYDASDVELSPQQDEVYWRVATTGVTMGMAGTVSKGDAIKAGLTYAGITKIGWDALAPTIDPALRGPIAYVMGMRYRKLGKTADSIGFFEIALADASPDSTLRSLAAAELEKDK